MVSRRFALIRDGRDPKDEAIARLLLKRDANARTQTRKLHFVELHSITVAR